jgi:ATP phosphoribosyltransferase
MEEKRYLTFALGKGRLAKKTLELFEKIGITRSFIMPSLDSLCKDIVDIHDLRYPYAIK